MCAFDGLAYGHQSSFSADKMKIMDNKVQDQFQQGLVGLPYSTVQGYLNQVFHHLQWRQGKRPATNLLSLVENQCKEHHPPGVSIISALKSFHMVIVTYLDTFTGPDHSR